MAKAASKNTLPLWMMAIALIAGCAFIYAQTGSHEFINYDDPNYVLKNRAVNSGWTLAGFKWAFTSVDYYYWHPLTWISLMTDCQLFGVNPGPMHLVSAGLHALNAALLLVALWMLTGSVWRSAFAAGLFAFHPLRVESVAWIAERKDVLSGLFFLLTLIAYARYARLPSRSRYAWVIAAFMGAVMSKPTVVTLPLILLLLDWWPLRRWSDQKQLLVMAKEKAPMLVVVAISSVLTFIGQHIEGATVSLTALPVWYRLWNACMSYVMYLGKAIWPVDMGVLYPMGKLNPIEVTGALLLLAAITVAVIWTARSHGYLAVGWLWFLGAMVPMIGLAQSGVQAFADRFTYLPMIGLSFAVSWGLAELCQRWQVPLAVRAGAGGLLLGVLAFASIVQTSYWKDSFTLFEHTIAVTKDNDIININMALLYEQRGDLDRALPHYEEALRIEPKNFETHVIAGIGWFRKRNVNKAMEHFEAALKVKPDYPQATRGLADCLLALGRKDEARKMLQELLARYPNDVDARVRLLMMGQ